MNLKIAIEIGSEWIKIIEGYEKGGKLYILNIKKIEVPIENFLNLTDEDTQILGNFLSDFLKKNNFRSKNTVFSITSNDAIYHYFELPILPKEELENAIKLEGIQLIPDFNENYDFDYISFDLGNKKNIVLIAYPKNKVKIYNQILINAKLKPLIMDIPGTALLNSFLYFNRKENPICLLNLGFSVSNVVIYLREGFLFLRDILSGIKNLKKSEETYDQILTNEKMTEFNEEIKMSLTYFENKTGQNVNKIYLTGEVLEINSLKESIEKNIGISTEIYNPLLFVPDSTIPVEKKQEGMSYAICIGLLTRKII